MAKLKLSAAERTAAAIHVFMGIGAMAGGSAAILEPDNPLGVPVSMLVNSPFTNFFIPGLLLFGVIGVGNLIASAGFFTRRKSRPYISGFFASALVIWIVVQCVMIQAIVALHVIFFLIGVFQGLLALYLLLR